MRHKPGTYLSKHPYRVISAHNERGEQLRLLYDDASVLACLRDYTYLTLYGDEGYPIAEVGIVKHFEDSKAITLEDNMASMQKFLARRPKLRLVIEIKFGTRRKPDRYIGMTIEASGMETGALAGFRKEFRSHDPLVDWVDMINYVKAHPASYWPDNASFHEFVHSIPGYRFVLDEKGAEVLVRDPDEAVAGPEQGVIVQQPAEAKVEGN